MFIRADQNLLSGCSLAAIVMFAAAPSAARDSTASAAEVNPVLAAPTKASAETQDIVVTANKREQNLSKVGLSVTAFTGETLANQRVSTVADLAKITPGLNFAATPNATPVYTLRGVGFYEASLAAYPDVSLYLDQVPLSLPIMASLTVFDLERVEVLKGPQGTLFGNNATGGAINFVAARPSSTFHAGLNVSYGRFDTVEVAGFITSPITDTLRARIAFKSVSGDGWQKSYTRDDTLGKLDNQAVRVLLDWDPVDALSISLNLNAWRDRNDPQAPQAIGFSPQYPAPADAPILNYALAPRNARAADWTPGLNPNADNTFKQATLRADYRLGGLTLTSLTGKSHLDFRNATEGGGTALIDLDIRQDKGKIDSFTQELRLSNSAAGRFRWVLGANYEHTDVDEQIALQVADTTATYFLPLTNSTYGSDQKLENYAAFGNAEFDVSDRITLKAGIRQTKAKRRSVAGTYDDFIANPIRPGIDVLPGTTIPGTALSDIFNGLYGAIYGNRPDETRVVPLIQPGQPITLDTRLNPDGTPVDTATYLTTSFFRNRLNEDATSWSVGVDIKPTDRLLLYANVSKGYKAGSLPTISASIFDGLAGVEQESIIAYEAGLKFRASRAFSINAAAFYYDYRDKQLRAKFVDPIFGALDQLTNVPKSTVKGAEIEINARPLNGLTISGSATYLDAKVKEYIGVVGSTLDVNGLRQAVLASFEGTRLPFSPKLQYAARLDYETPISGTLGGFFGVGLNGQSKTTGVLTTFGVDPSLFKINARAIVDANLGIQSPKDGWRLTLWGKNILNKYYWNNAIQAYDTVVRYTARPAEYGVTLGFRM